MKDWFKKHFTVRKVLFASSLLLILVSFVAVDFRGRQKEEVFINIDEKDGNFFVVREDVLDIIDEIKRDHPTTARLHKIGLRPIEEKLRSIDFVLDAQVSRDLKGNLIVEIEQDQPIARILASDGGGAYISEDLDLLGLSDSYSARVLLLSGAGSDSLLSKPFINSTKGQEICRFVKYINRHPFWKAQIAQLDFDENLDMVVYTQVGKEKFQFGQAKNFEDKLEKMKLFYDEIVPKKGWGHYKVVKLQYKDQIVCD